jgi:hypothetical protein
VRYADWTLGLAGVFADGPLRQAFALAIHRRRASPDCMEERITSILRSERYVLPVRLVVQASYVANIARASGEVPRDEPIPFRKFVPELIQVATRTLCVVTESRLVLLRSWVHVDEHAKADSLWHSSCLILSGARHVMCVRCDDVCTK